MQMEEQRKSLITSIEAQREGARVLSLVTGDRRGHETRIAADVLPLVYDHLTDLGEVEEIDLFLYTPGGDTLSGFGLVNLLREFCRKLVVIVPFRALSCGTLIALGADEIIMSKGAQLSPVDVSVSSPYNPQAPGVQPQGRVNLLPVSVEEMMGFLNLARKEAGLKNEESISKIVLALAEKVHPLALGAVYRAREQTSMLAKRLLKSHVKDESKAEAIVNKLTKELPSHNYLVSRTEAKEIGLNVIDVPADFQKIVWGLYREYEKWLELTVPYNAESVLGTQEVVVHNFPRAALESLHNGKLKGHMFRTEKELKRVQMAQPGITTPVSGVQERILNEGWIQYP